MPEVMSIDPQPTPRRSTIHDVARLAGVSIKTVSRVVRQEPNVTEKTRQVVKSAMNTLHYRPTMSARSTVSSRSFLLGLVFDNPNPSYTFDLLRGAQDAARRQGYHLVVEPIDPSTGDPGQQIADLAVQSNLEGLIIPPPLCDLETVIAALGRIGRPFARIAPSREPTLGFSVSMDDHAAAMAMTDHLLQLGHRQIAFIKGRAGTATTAKRLRGYCDAMAANNIVVPDEWIQGGSFDMRSGFEAADVLLSLVNPPSAIFASNDDMAAGALMAAQKHGLVIPDDLSIAGFDDSVMASAMWPSLTTVRQPVADMAGLAAQRLIEHQRDGGTGSPDSEVLKFEIIVRASTGPAPK